MLIDIRIIVEKRSLRIFTAKFLRKNKYQLY